MAKIKEFFAREILNSKGIPTVLVYLLLDSGRLIEASAPSGTSKSRYELAPRVDGGKRFGGYGIQRMLEETVPLLQDLLIGEELELEEIDNKLIQLNGEEKQGKLGGALMIATSMAACRAQAETEDQELFQFIGAYADTPALQIPTPLFNFINGGAHGNSTFPIQEILFIPYNFETLGEIFEGAYDVFHTLQELLKKKQLFFGIGDEGGIVAPFRSVTEALDLMQEAIAKSVSMEHGQIGIDCAASQWYSQDTGLYTWQDKKFDRAGLLEWYDTLHKQYDLAYLEDPFAEVDHQGWILCQEQFSETSMLIVADDLCATNQIRIAQAGELDLMDSVIIKPDQIGTVTQAMLAVTAAEAQECNIVVSHRSGETNDTFITDFAIGMGASFIKLGGLCRGERVAKYNRFLLVHDMLATLILAGKAQLK